MNPVKSIDPRTARVVETVAEETTREQVDALCQAAQAAAPALEALGREGRAALLCDLADALEDRRVDIVRLADRETALGETRLNGELTRTCFQLRMFADVLLEGSYVEAAIDHAGDTPMGPRPDLRRMLLPIGPVAVFGASNFPLAFSVPGGDTVSALAAGCPVIVKAHEAHPATSELCFGVMSSAACRAGAPVGTLGMVYGLNAGAALVQHPVIQAVGFTGSLSGGKAIVGLINQRPDPIPFYGELSSLNPVVVTPSAVAARAEEVGRGLAGSVTLGAGQFCTKPGLSFVPAGADGDRLVEAMRGVFTALEAQFLLNERIAATYADGVERLRSTPGVDVVATGGSPDGPGYAATPTLLVTGAKQLRHELTEEVFGPVAVIARYTDQQELLDALDALPASLTVTLQTGAEDNELAPLVLDRLRPRSGRLVFNAFPTGVAVGWAQHHGGPWPSTNTAHTSVGATSIRRFLRPVAWQSAPESVLPPELHDDAPQIPRRIDGVLVIPQRG